MKARYLSVVLASSLFCATVQADLYTGIKAGTMLIGFDDVEVSEDPSSVAVSVGYDFGSTGGLALEAEASRTVTAGNVVGNELEVQSQGVYIAYQTTGAVYIKGRVGFMDASLSAGDLSEDEGGETYGLALGFRLSGFNVEVDFTAVDDDVSFLSLGFRY